MITVVHLVTGLGSGGAERQLTQLVLHGRQGAMRHVVISMMDEGIYGAALRDAGIELHCLAMSRGMPSFAAFRKLIRLLKQINPDVLQTWLYHADLMGTIAAKIRRSAALVWNVRCSDMDWSRYSWLSRLVVRLLAVMSSAPDAVVVNSAAGQRFHAGLGYHPARWELIPNMIDVDRFHPNDENRAETRRQLGVGAETSLVAMPARYDPMKDHETFLSAAAAVCREISDARVVLIGKGCTPQNPELLGLLKKYGLADNALLLGERTDMERLYPAMDVVVVASAFGEGFSNVLGEAMACGVSCVATDVGDSAHILNGTGMVVPPRSPEKLAEATRQFLLMDERDRQVQTTKARARIVEAFSPDTAWERYSGLYKSLI